MIYYGVFLSITVPVYLILAPTFFFSIVIINGCSEDGILDCSHCLWPIFVLVALKVPSQRSALEFMTYDAL